VFVRGSDRGNRILDGKPESKRPLGRLCSRWRHDAEIDLKEMGCKGVDLIDPAEDRGHWWSLVDTVVNFVLFEVLEIS
jgi:hypothetical protein